MRGVPPPAPLPLPLRRWVKSAMTEAPLPARLLCLPPKRGSVLLRVDPSAAPSASASGGGSGVQSLRGGGGGEGQQPEPLAGAGGDPLAPAVGASPQAGPASQAQAQAGSVVSAPEHGIASLAGESTAGASPSLVLRLRLPPSPSAFSFRLQPAHLDLPLGSTPSTGLSKRMRCGRAWPLPTTSSSGHRHCSTPPRARAVAATYLRTLLHHR